MAYGDVVATARRRRGTVNFGNLPSMQQGAESAYNTEAGYGSDATTAYLERARNFNASDALKQYAQGAWGSVSEGLKKTLADLRGQAVGAGRSDTGFLDEDQGQVIRNVMNDFTNNLSRESLGAAQLQQSSDEALGRFGESSTQDANDLLASEREFEYNAAEQRKKNRNARGSAIGGALGALGGSFIPGVGTVLGGTIGSAIGGIL